ncbi:FadR/GntR family transcriptional regulator [Corynebacterium uberis]|uniref:FadR/GntR family transcriptional regulator n=1 Tax=Corynebacterium TaxID=1716 RepID=UPI001D0B758C|nr:MULTISPECIES: FCD domain-containing protein [Corynebacterium]MCZ9309794.1 FCD domain-containing protein [Corynebacterium sp. c6VSa_13]UDL73594.1 FCD domain-containing protein [Corynebacterium uberis]UDL75526.1 FCD domain-containing protein [Corynebacterium uberis]UDL77739.1 FCD domain-containing protein [Corynebacterium uberis]UDL80023.1 FCD domain-containing protein [Corynebacterium uberis]
MAHATPAPRRAPSATEAAMEGVKDYIRIHRLSPGDMLPSEAVLCTELGCSRSSVREAVRILATLDIVEVKHGYGTYVSEMSLEPLVQGLVFRTILGAEHELAHVVDTREALDLSLGAELMESVTAADAAGLRELVAQMRQAERKGEPFTTQDQQFHRTLLSHISNPLIRELSDAFWRVHMEVVPLLGLDKPERIGQTVDAHGDILDALAARDDAAYRAAVARHYEPLRAALGLN